MMAGARRQMSRQSLVAAASVCTMFLALTGCEPWGKPKEEPPPAENVMEFKPLFEQNCSGCHGVDGKNGPGRPLNNPIYLAVIPKQVLQQVIENGRPGTSMPPWARSRGGPLTDKQIAVLVNGIESNWATPVNLQAAPPPSYSGENQTGDTMHGKKLFLRDCFMCHGPGAPVGPVTNPSYLQLVTNQMLRTSIIVGRADMGMPDYRFLNMGHALTDQDVSDLVAYLSSMRPANAALEMVSGSGASQAGGASGHSDENGTGQAGPMTKGNEGSGNGPGSPRQQKNEGNKSTGSSSQRGGK